MHIINYPKETYFLHGRDPSLTQATYQFKFIKFYIKKSLAKPTKYNIINYITLTLQIENIYSN
jgi:hypothetical protein